MKKAVQSGLLVLFMAGILSARVFLVGSNPYLSIFAFPQDVFLTHGDYAYAYTTYNALPWWGDLDQPDLKPSIDYLSTKGSVNYGPNGDKFEHRSTANQVNQYLGFAYALNEKAKLRVDAEYAVQPMRSRASGELYRDRLIERTTFDFEQKTTVNKWRLKSLLGVLLGEIPFGVRVGFGAEHTSEPEISFVVDRDGTTYNVDRRLWGWSEHDGLDAMYLGGSVAHARNQDHYAFGSLYRLDAQVAATFPRLKIGTRFRYNFGNLEQRDWDAGEPLSVQDSAFINAYQNGRYQNGPSKEISNKTIRLYGNYTWIKREKFRFNTLALTRYTYVDSVGVLMDNDEAETGKTERSRTFVLQVNPNVNIYPWDLPMCYIDAAILCNYQHMSYDFLDEGHWVSGGGRVEGYADTRVRTGKDYAWDNFSYGKENFFEVALDLNPVLPLYGNKNVAVAAGINMLLWTRFMWFNKYYGTTHNGEFHLDNVRRNFDREIWLHSALNLTIRAKPYTFRVAVGQPLIYNLQPRTRVFEADGETVLYEYRREAMWLSESGVHLGLFFSTDLQTLGSLADHIGNR